MISNRLTSLRDTAKRLAEQLGVDELALKVLPQYEADDGPVNAAQLRQIKKHVPQGSKRSVRSSLFNSL